MADEYYTYFDAYDRISSFANPAYYFLTVVSFEMFGVSELSARLPAFLFGALIVPVFYIIWSRLISENAALLGAALQGNGFNDYAKGTYQLQRIAGNSRDNSVNWKEKLRGFSDASACTWLILPVSRELPAKELELWLRSNGRLVWRKVATRFDYTHRGFEIYLVGGPLP